jgi:lipid-binding SYLF domain-containing protein
MYKPLPGLLLATVFLVFLLASPVSRAGPPASSPARPKPTPAAPASSADAKAVLADEIRSAALFYHVLQQDPNTAVPDWVAILCKGVLIFDRWSGSVVIGASGGVGIGVKKEPSGRFSAPAFYHVGGASFGLQFGGAHTRVVAFLMSAKALQILTDSDSAWTGNVRMVIGDNADSSDAPPSPADIIIFEQTSGFDFSAAIASNTVSVANDNNRLFYGQPDLTPQDIFAGKVPMPEVVRPLIRALNQRAALTTDQFNSPD